MPTRCVQQRRASEIAALRATRGPTRFDKGARRTVHEPRLTRVERSGCAFWTDDALLHRAGVLIAFSERQGGVSGGPYRTLNLASSVDDRARDVDENRSRFFTALGVSPLRDRLVMAEQVHGIRVALVDGTDAGRGAWAEGSALPVEGCDGLVTCEIGLPLMLCFADCVPVVLVALSSQGAAVAVLHAGWRGVRDRIETIGARALTQALGCDPCNVLAYIGPHICGTHYEVDADVASQSDERFATFSRTDRWKLDLGATVSARLVEVGVMMSSQCSLAECTAEHTDRFFSHRAESGLTGRHAAFAAITRPVA